MVNRLNGVAAHATWQPPLAGMVKSSLFVTKAKLLSPRAVGCIVARGLMSAYEVESILENEDNRGVDGNLVEEIK